MRVAETAAIGVETSHDQQQSQIVLLAPHQGGNKPRRRCNHATLSLDDLWPAFPCLYPAGLALPIFLTRSGHVDDPS